MTTLTHEQLTQGEVFLRSGAGTLYHVPPQGQALLYKHVFEKQSFSNSKELSPRLWQSMQPGSDWVVPKQLVYDSTRCLTGYLVNRVKGTPLSHSFAAPLD